MNKMIRTLSSIATVVVLLAMTTILAFAKELTSLSISGPGIDGEMTLTDPVKDPGAMGRLEQSGLFDRASLAKPPADLAQGYTITAHLNLDGKVVPFVQMVYYPGQEGEPGYVHYTGRYDGTSLQAVDEWGTMRPEAEAALRDLTAAYGITLQPGVAVAASAGAGSESGSRAPASASATTTSAKPAAFSVGYPLLAAATALGALTAGIWVVTGRRARRQAAQTGDD
jgi:hypothetical protein